MTEKERKNLLIECYKDNQKFIDTITFTAALGSIPLAIGFVDTISQLSCCAKAVFMLANYCAAIVVIAHIYGAVMGKKSCNAALENNKQATQYHNAQNTANNIVNIAFVGMIGCYIYLMQNLVCGG